ncbi:hypothetical protein [Pokkaliibacter plantistimulans]|nr:hypothetical protein [Pokkaliibacter plantistimulans]
MAAELSCEKPQYIIEILGYDHPTTQKLMLEGQQAPTQTKVDGGAPYGHSTVHKWPAPNSHAREAWIEIECESGPTLQLPVFDGEPITVDSVTLPGIPKVSPSAMCGTRQDYVIAPIVPIVQGITYAPMVTRTPLACRNGYLYIFRSGQLWRELEISTQEHGKDVGQPRFRDADILKARNGQLHGPLQRQAPRPIVGKPLEEIWLPVRAKGNAGLPVFRLFYSEVRLSNERLAWYENHYPELAKRSVSSVSFTPALSELITPKSEDDDFQPLAAGRLIRLNDVPRQRPRSPVQERHYARPDQYLLDLSGVYPLNEYQTARLYLAQQQTHLPDDISAAALHQALLKREQERAKATGQSLTAPSAQVSGHVAGSRRLSSEDTSLADYPYLEQEIEDSMWQRDPALPDLYQPLRSRHICALPVTDALAILRTALNHCQAGQNLLDLVIGMATTDQDYRFAELVNTLVLPPCFAFSEGERQTTVPNNWHGYADDVDNQPGSPLQRILRTPLRTLVRTLLNAAQLSILTLLNREEIRLVMGDMFSLNASDYYAGFKLAGDVLAQLAVNPTRLDVFEAPHFPQTAVVNPYAMSLLESIFSDRSHWLAMMLLPELNTLDTEQPAEQQAGSGRFRGELLMALRQYTIAQRYEQADHTLSDQPQTEEVGLIATLVAALQAAPEQGANAIQSGLPKRVSNDMDAVFGGLIGGAMAMVTGNLAKFRLAADALYELMQQADGPLIGQIVKFPLGGSAELKGTIMGMMFGQLTDGMTGDARWDFSTQEQNAYRLYNADGSPVLSSKIDPARRQGLPLSLDDAYVWVLPDNAALHEEYQRVNNISRIEKRAAELLDSPTLTKIMMLFEMVNLTAEAESIRGYLADGRVVRGVGGMVSAVWDITLCSANLVTKLNLQHRYALQVEATLSKLVITPARRTAWLNRFAAGSLTQRIMGAMLPKFLTLSAGAGAFGYVLTALVSATDMMERARAGDRAGTYSQLAILTGSLALAAGMFRSVRWLGWPGLLVTISGAVAYTALKKDDLTLLLSRGPLSRTPDSRHYPHLINHPAEASYRLLSLLNGMAFSVQLNPYYKGAPTSTRPADFAEMTFNNDLVHCLLRVTLSGQLSACMQGAHYRFYARWRQPAGLFTGLSSGTALRPRHISPHPQGRTYYFLEEQFHSVLPGGGRWPLAPAAIYSYVSSHQDDLLDVLLRAQVQLSDGQGGTLLLPAPSPLTDASTFNASQHNQPSWTGARAFWLDNQESSLFSPDDDQTDYDASTY